MAGAEPKVDLMQKYPIPQTPADINFYTYLGFAIFGISLVVIAAMALYFG